MSDFLIGVGVTINGAAVGIGAALWKVTTQDGRWQSKVFHGSLIAFNVVMIGLLTWLYVQ